MAGTDDRSLAQNQVSDAGTPSPDQPTQVASNVQPSSNAGAQPTPTAGGQPNAAPAGGQPPIEKAATPATSKPSGSDHVSTFRHFMETLAGPAVPVYKVDEKGNLVASPASRRPMGSLTKSIVAGALTGLFADLGDHGPGAAGRQASAGFKASAAMHEKADDDAKQQATTDFARRQNVFDSNMRAMGNAIQYGRLQKEDHDSMVGSFKSQIDDLKENAADTIKGERLSETEAADLQKHSMFDLLRIPDGTVPRIGQDGKPVFLDTEGKVVPQGTPGAYQAWDNTYTLVDKNAKVSLSDSSGPKPWVKAAVDRWDGVIPGINKSLLSGNGAQGQITAATAGKMMHQAVALDGLQSELNKYCATLNEGKKESAADYVKPISLRKALDDGSISLNDVVKFQRAAKNSTQPDDQITALYQNDPDTAGKMMALFNQGGDLLGQFKLQRDTKKQVVEKSAKASVIADENDAKYVLAHSDKYDQAHIDAANKFLDLGVQQSADRSQAEEAAKNEADQAAVAEQEKLNSVPQGFKMPESDQLSTMTLEQLQGYLQKSGVSVPKNFASLYSVGSEHSTPLNKTFPTRISRGTNQLDADHALTYIRQFINPNFRDSDYDAAKQFNTRLADPQKSPITAAGVAAQHLNLLNDAGRALNTNDLQKLNEIAAFLKVQTGKSAPVVFKAIADQVNTEVGKVVAGGPPHEAELAKLAENLSTKQSQEQINGVIKGYLGLMSGRLSELNYESRQYFNRDLKINPVVTKLFQSHGLETGWDKQSYYPPMSAFANKADGEPVKFKNGQVWKKQDGQLVQVEQGQQQNP